MSLPHIVIIILHYKNLSDTRECLDSLKKVDYPPSLSPPPLPRRGLGEGSGGFSIIVVNNDILDNKTALEHEYGDFIKIIQNSENLGFCEGNNVGIRHALDDNRTDAVLLLNNDTVVEQDFLSNMASYLPSCIQGGIKGGSGSDMISPRMMQYYNRDKVDNLGIVLMSSGLPFNRTNENQKLFCPNGGCALYSRELLESVRIVNRHPELVSGSVPESCEQMPKQVRHDDISADGYYFDPIYFAYCEDLDLGWRARNAGFEAGYAPGAIVYHKGSAIHGKLSDFAVYHTYRNLIWTQFKNLPWTLLLWQSPWLFFGWVSLFAYYLTKGRAGLIIKACLDGLLGLRFMFNKRNAAQKTKIAKNKTILSWFETGLFPKNLLK